MRFHIFLCEIHILKKNYLPARGNFEMKTEIEK